MENGMERKKGIAVTDSWSLYTSLAVATVNYKF